MTGTELRVALRGLGLTQAEFAKQIGVRQTTISAWINVDNRLPAPVITRLQELLRQSNLTLEQLRLANGSEVISDFYSWPAYFFRKLWRDDASLHRVKQIIVDAVIKPSKTPGYADCQVLMHFKQMLLRGSDGVHFDHDGFFRRKPNEDAETEKPWLFGPSVISNSNEIHLEIDSDLKAAAADGVIKYSLHSEQLPEAFTIAINAHRGLATNASGRIDIPLYGNLISEKLAFEINFVGFRPVPDPPDVGVDSTR